MTDVGCLILAYSSKACRGQWIPAHLVTAPVAGFAGAPSQLYLRAERRMGERRSGWDERIKEM